MNLDLYIAISHEYKGQHAKAYFKHFSLNCRRAVVLCPHTLGSSPLGGLIAFAGWTTSLPLLTNHSGSFNALRRKRWVHFEMHCRRRKCLYFDLKFVPNNPIYSRPPVLVQVNLALSGRRDYVNQCRCVAHIWKDKHHSLVKLKFIHGL